MSAVWLYGAMYYYVMHVHALFEPASHTAIQQTRIVPPPLYLVCTVYSSYITYTVQPYSIYTIHLHTPPLSPSAARCDIFGRRPMTRGASRLAVVAGAIVGVLRLVLQEWPATT